MFSRSTRYCVELWTLRLWSLTSIGIVSNNSTLSFKTFTEVNGGLFILPYPKLQIELWPCYSTSVMLVIFVPLKWIFNYCFIYQSINFIQLLHLNEINMRFYGAEYNNIERGEAEFNIVVLCSIKPHWSSSSVVIVVLHIKALFYSNLEILWKLWNFLNFLKILSLNFFEILWNFWNFLKILNLKKKWNFNNFLKF